MSFFLLDKDFVDAARRRAENLEDRVDAGNFVHFLNHSRRRNEGQFGLIDPARPNAYNGPNSKGVLSA
jgi:hypothetical protein